ncbi:MAG TPA: S8 family serine peptidase [Thermoanaerobaculia bacterium]|nr:S8 family serine peptidase [Thermoanaerobaculia bacterium]
MYILNTKRQKVQLARLDTEVLADPATGRAAVAVAARRGRDPVNASSLVNRACRAFFGVGGQQPGKAAAIPEQVGPPPAAFRETATGLLHVVYREIVVRFRHDTPQNRRQAILRDRGFEVRRQTPLVPDQLVVYHPDRRYSGEELVEISNGWMELDEVLFSTPNFVSQFLRQAPPSIRSEEWHLRNKGTGGATKGEDVNVSPAWKITRGQGIVVAVLDDGVDIDHPNLKANIWKNPNAAAPDKNGRDFFVPPDHPEHFNPRPKRFTFPFDLLAGNDSHGTPCAGIIAALGKGSGSVGVAPACRILPVKIFHADDLASSENVANAIRYAATHADILSCSWSGGFNLDIELALEDAGQIGRGGRGAAVFCAAGNEFASPVGFPARDPNSIAVGASTDQKDLASYSNVGPEISLVAPSSGGIRGIFTTDVSLPNRGFNVGLAAAGGANGLHTNSFGGTSSATPLAAGVGALVLSVNPNLSRSDLRDLLQSTADKIGPDHDAAGHSNRFGFGRVNAGKAVAQAQALLPS